MGVIFMDISKAFDTVRHSLLLALKTYTFSDQAFSSLQSYLCNRFWHNNYRSVMNSFFSSCNGMITAVPEGSILDAVLFTIFLNDIFPFILKFQL